MPWPRGKATGNGCSEEEREGGTIPFRGETVHRAQPKRPGDAPAEHRKAVSAP